MILVDVVILLFNVIYYSVNLKEYIVCIKNNFEKDFMKYNVFKELGKFV